MRRNHPASKFSLAMALLLLLIAGLAGANTALPNRMGGDDRSPVQLLTSPTWEIALTDFGYSDYLGYYRGYSHEMLSGEWGGAVSYEMWDPAAGAWVPKFSWLDPEWIFPDWLTGSSFGVVVPLTVSDTNADTYIDHGYSEISNGDVLVKITHQFVDARTPMGLGLGTGSSVISEQWILRENYELVAISPEPLRNINYYRFLHGHPSEDFDGVDTYEEYDNAFYSYPDPVWPGQECYIHDITQWSGYGGNNGGLGREYIAFHSLQAPSGYGLGEYAGAGVGKPAAGLHIDVENTDTLLNNHGLFGPTEVAGAMRWFFCRMQEGDSNTIDLILSVGAEEEIGCCNVDAFGQVGIWDNQTQTYNYGLNHCPGMTWSDQVMFCLADCDGSPLNYNASDFTVTRIHAGCEDDIDGITLRPDAPSTDPNGCMPFLLEVPDCISVCCEIVWEIRVGNCVFYFRLDLKTYDLDGDGLVDGHDEELFWSYYMQNQDLCADWSRNGIVDDQDIQYFWENIDCNCANTAAGASATPSEFKVLGNVPNPFNPKTQIRFELPGAGNVEVGIFTVSGRRIATLLDSRLPAGRHSVEWNGTSDAGESMPSGIYFYRVESDSGRATEKMTLIK
jgi:hypothetical protein